MKNIITILATLLCAGSLQAERVNVGGHFSIYVPDYWKVDLSGETANNPGNYLVYKARTIDPKAPKIWFTLGVLNNQDPTKVSLDDLNRYTEADLSSLAKENRQTGYNLPTARKAMMSGIPAFIVNTQNEKEKFNLLDITLFIRDRKFAIRFIYFKDGTNTVNKILDSLRLEDGWTDVPTGAIIEPPSPTPTPTPSPTPQASTEDTDKKDCLITATETYARLKSSAHWAKILAFQIHNNGQYAYSHAIVVYQPTPTSSVFLYDKALGSLDVHTQSHELAEIISALNKNIVKEGVAIVGPRWVD